jgi:hypothetical protein
VSGAYGEPVTEDRAAAGDGPVLVPGGGRSGGWTLFVDGVPQSYVDPADPTYLEFEYVRRIARLIDVAAPAGAPLSVLHLGGGALTLPRYVAATRPGSRQRVAERDAGLIDLVHRRLPLPRRAGIRVMLRDARETVLRCPDGVYDLVVSDVYRAARMPASVASVEFAAEVARVLGPHGRYAVNVADLRTLAYARRQAATLAAVFPDVCAVAEPGMLRGRRYGNVVLVAARAPGGLPVEPLAAAVRRDPFPARVLHGPDLARFVGGARPMDDRGAEDSPRPPPTPLLPG